MKQPVRGAVVVCPDGVPAVVWSVTVGIVHAIPCVESGPGILVAIGGRHWVIDTEARRHIPVDRMRRIGQVNPAVIGVIETAIRSRAAAAENACQAKRDADRIRIAAYQARRRRLASANASVLT